MERVNNNELFNDLFINMNSNIIVKRRRKKKYHSKRKYKILKECLKIYITSKTMQII